MKTLHIERCANIKTQYSNKIIYFIITSGYSHYLLISMLCNNYKKLLTSSTVTLQMGFGRSQLPETDATARVDSKVNSILNLQHTRSRYCIIQEHNRDQPREHLSSFRTSITSFFPFLFSSLSSFTSFILLDMLCSPRKPHLEIKVLI